MRLAAVTAATRATIAAPTAQPPQSERFLQEFAPELRALGVTNTTVLGNWEVELQFGSIELATLGSAALRDAVDGVDLRIRFEGGEPPFVPTAAQVARHLQRLPGVMGWDWTDLGDVILYAGTEERADRLWRVVRRYLPSGHLIHVVPGSP